jgi:uncharacterized protein (TIGR00369 family)
VVISEEHILVLGVTGMLEKRDDILNAFRDNSSALPFHRFLGLGPECFDAENKCIRFDMRDEFVGNQHYNILHGGVIATVLDIAGGFVLALNGAWNYKASATGSALLIKGGTIDLHIDYLRPGKGKQFVASGTILRHGNKVAVVRSELVNEQNELIAVALGTYLVG